MQKIFNEKSTKLVFSECQMIEQKCTNAARYVELSHIQLPLKQAVLDSIMQDCSLRNNFHKKELQLTSSSDHGQNVGFWLSFNESFIKSIS